MNPRPLVIAHCVALVRRETQSIYLPVLVAICIQTIAKNVSSMEIWFMLQLKLSALNAAARELCIEESHIENDYYYYYYYY